jgi:HEAT repeat protein
MTPAAQRRGAIYAAIGAVACASLLLVVWPDRGDHAVVAFAPPDESLTRPSPSSSRVDGDSSSEATVLDRRDPPGAAIDAPTIDVPTIDVLVVALGDADANVRMDAVSDLGLLSDPRAESLLASIAMQDPAPLVRIEALYALGTLRAESQLGTFRQALDDPDEDVRKAASIWLEELGALEELADIRTAR